MAGKIILKSIETIFFYVPKGLFLHCDRSFVPNFESLRDCLVRGNILVVSKILNIKSY